MSQAIGSERQAVSTELFVVMRSIVALMVAVIALSTMARGHSPFVPHPTERMPPVNVP